MIEKTKPLRSLHIVQENNNVIELDRVAFATHDKQRVDQHFGTAHFFLIFSFTRAQWHLIDVIEFPNTQPGHDAHKLANRIEYLTGCSQVYCTAIGHSAIKNLLKKTIKPHVVDERSSIEDILKQRHQTLLLTHKKQTSRDKNSALESLLNEQWHDDAH